MNIEGCKVYLNPSQCTTCHDGYDLTNGLCYALTESSRCLISSNGVCQTCKNNYIMVNKLCYDPFEYQQYNCWKMPLS